MRRLARPVWALLLVTWLAILACSAPVPERTSPSSTRVISLVPAATEMLFVMGAGPDVVGVSSFDRFPPEVESLPKVGALVDPDFERILSLRPTLVIVYASQTDLIERLSQASIPVHQYVHAVDNGLADVTRTLRLLGARLDRASAAESAAARIEAELDDVRRKVAGRTRPRTVLVFGREAGALRGMYASGGVGFLHDLLEIAGGADVFGDVARESVQVSIETLLARQPEVIVELRTTGLAPARVAQELAVWQGLPGLPAVRDGRVHILTDPALSIPGPRVGAAARALAAAVHPDAP
jgi:iron complex transport system substrate-binding protein